MSARWTRQDVSPGAAGLLLVGASAAFKHDGLDADNFSRVPKELISRFVKLCPTCRARRGSTSSSVPTPISPKAPANYLPTKSPEPLSPSASRRESLLSHRSPTYAPSSANSTMFGDHYSQQSWVSASHHLQSPVHRSPSHTVMHSPTGHYDQQSIPMASYGIQGNGLSHRSYPGNYEAGTLNSTNAFY